MATASDVSKRLEEDVMEALIGVRKSDYFTEILRKIVSAHAGNSAVPVFPRPFLHGLNIYGFSNNLETRLVRRSPTKTLPHVCDYNGVVKLRLTKLRYCTRHS